jgi:hypothetical protein
MASSLNADNGVVSGSSGLKSTADTSGVLALQSNGNTALTINTDLSVTFAGSVATPTLTNPTITNYTETTYTANSSTAITLDLANGTLQIITLTGNCTYTFPTATAGKSFTLFQKQDATGSRTVTWPATVKWPAGTAPTITSTALKLDKFVFTADGTNWYGSVAGQNYTV